MIRTEKIWSDILSFLEKGMNNQSFDTWFKPLNLAAIDGNDVTISVPNRFFEEWIREHYYQLLCQEVGKAIHSENVKINFAIKGKTAIAPSAEKEQKRSGKSKTASLLNPRHTFENFIVGSCNQFAHAACLAVAESPAKAYNPLFLYGGVGLGKTHLLCALGNSSFVRRPGSKIAYMSSEKFTNEVINSIRYDKMAEFRNKYRSVDILLIDDIQFIAGKERTQEEFFHTFNTLYDARKQIVISSDQFPKDMPEMEERIRSRFEWGLIADLHAPDLETKIAILKRKAEAEQILLPDEVSHFLATHIRTNIRELEGALVRLGAFSSLMGQSITIDLAKKVLRDIIQERKKVVSADEISKVVAERFHMRPIELKAKKRTKALVMPRQVAMYLCREIANMSYPHIGQHFGGKDHTTVIHACRRIEKQAEIDGSLRQMLDRMIHHFKE
jgi:chromosomal replication initiator protein